MTWNFVAVGPRDAVKAHIRGLPRVPGDIRTALFAAMDRIQGDVTFYVESAGGLDESGGNVKFNVRSKNVFSGVVVGEGVG